MLVLSLVSVLSFFFLFVHSGIPANGMLPRLQMGLSVSVNLVEKLSHRHPPTPTQRFVFIVILNSIQLTMELPISKFIG